MKTRFSKLMLGLAAALGFVVGSGPAKDAGAAQILYYVDLNIGTDAMAAALTSLAGSHTTTYATNLLDFATKIATNSYDLGILSQQSQNGPDYDTAFSALNAFIAAGGRAIATDWTRNDAHFVDFGATFTGNVNSDTLSVSDPNLAAGVGDPVSLTNPGWGVFSTGLNGPAAATFTLGSAAGEAAIVIGNGGRTIVNGFLNDTFTSTDQGRQLYVNEIGYVLGAGAVPEPASMAMLAIGLAAVGGLGVRARRAS